MRDGRAEAKALGQVVTFGVGHPVAVERIFCAAEAIDLLVGIADCHLADRCILLCAAITVVHVLPSIEQNGVKSFAQVGLA